MRHILHLELSKASRILYAFKKGIPEGCVDNFSGHKSPLSAPVLGVESGHFDLRKGGDEWESTPHTDVPGTKFKVNPIFLVLNIDNRTKFMVYFFPNGPFEFKKEP